MINATSVATTMSTKLVNPKVFSITSIRLFNHPGIVTRKLGNSSKQASQKLLLIEMHTHESLTQYVTTEDVKPFQSILLGPDAQARAKMLRHNLLVMPRKNDPRIRTLKEQRPPECDMFSVLYSSYVPRFRSRREELPNAAGHSLNPQMPRRPPNSTATTPRGTQGRHPHDPLPSQPDAPSRQPRSSCSGHTTRIHQRAGPPPPILRPQTTQSPSHRTHRNDVKRQQ